MLGEKYHYISYQNIIQTTIDYDTPFDWHNASMENMYDTHEEAVKNAKKQIHNWELLKQRKAILTKKNEEEKSSYS